MQGSSPILQGGGNALTLQGGGGSGGLVLQGGGANTGIILQPATAPTSNMNLTSGGSNQSSSAPAAPSGGVYNNSGGGGSSDPGAVAYYNDVIAQLQSQLDATKAQQGTGVSNIENLYNKAVGRQNESESAAESGYKLQHTQNGTQRESNINSINDNSRATFDSLMGILGANGAGVSSAALVGAPQAVAKDASGKRAGANTTFNTNESSINTAEDQTKQSYKNALDDLLTQKNSNEQNFLSGLLNTEGTLQQQIRDAQINRAQYGGQSYTEAAKGAGNTTDAVKNIQDQLEHIFSQYATPSFSVNPVTVTQPNLTNFSVDPTTVKSETANPSTDASFAPYLASLAPKSQNSILTGSAKAATTGAAS